MHCAAFAFSLAALRAGNNIAARMAMMAMTTRSSINVKPISCAASLDRTFGEISDSMLLHSFLIIVAIGPAELDSVFRGQFFKTRSVTSMYRDCYGFGRHRDLTKTQRLCSRERLTCSKRSYFIHSLPAQQTVQESGLFLKQPSGISDVN